MIISNGLIKDYIITKLEVDAVLGGLLGASAEDPRIYPVFDSEQIADATRPGFINFRILSEGEAGGRIRQPYVRLQIWALDWAKCEAITTQVIDILNKKKFTIPSVSRPIFVKKVYERDNDPEATSSTNFKGKTLDFRVGFEDQGKTGTT